MSSLTAIIELAKSMALILGLAFYAAIVIWTYKDARKRTDDPIMVATFTAIAMLPLFGVLIYMLVRPSEYLADVRERELEIRALERQLGRQERCPYCKSHIEGNYLSCPVCTTKLRQSCTGCEQPLDPRWVMCPFCETEVPGKGGRGPAGPGGGARRAAPGSRERSRPEGPARERAPRGRDPEREREGRAARPVTPAKAARSAKDVRPAEARTAAKDVRPSESRKDSAASTSKGEDIRTEPFGAGDATRI